MTGRDLVLAIAMRHNGEFAPMLKAIKDKEKIETEELEKISKSSIKCITILDELYPDSLKRIYQPPLALFYKGNIDLLKDTNMLGLLGNKAPSEYGVKATSSVLNELYILKTKKLPILVTTLGNPSSINSIAINTVLKLHGKVILIMKSGIDNIYPKASKDIYDAVLKNGGLILSEYPNKIEASIEHSKMAIRLVAGLGISLLVPETNKTDSSTHGIYLTLVQGKKVMVLPTDISAKSINNELIKEGGGLLVENAIDILNVLKEETK